MTEEKKQVIQNLIPSFKDTQNERLLASIILELVCEKTLRKKMLGELRSVSEIWSMN